LIVYRLGPKKLERFESECEENGRTPAIGSERLSGTDRQIEFILNYFNLLKSKSGRVPQPKADLDFINEYGRLMLLRSSDPSAFIAVKRRNRALDNALTRLNHSSAQTVITTHINADFDALASLLAAQKLYPEARVVFPGAQEKNLRDYLMRASPEVSAVIVKLKSVMVNKVTRLIIVDTRQLSRIGDFASIIGKDGVEVIIYDHHPPSGDDIVVENEQCKEYGSNRAFMVEILEENCVTPPPEGATILAIGIF